MKNKRTHRKYKDRVFRIIFRDKKELPGGVKVAGGGAVLDTAHTLGCTAQVQPCLGQRRFAAAMYAHCGRNKELVR